jgi:hypothetical protein
MYQWMGGRVQQLSGANGNRVQGQNHEDACRRYKAPDAGRKRRIQAVSVPYLHVPGKKWIFEAKHRGNNHKTMRTSGVEYQAVLSIYEVIRMIIER